MALLRCAQCSQAFIGHANVCRVNRFCGQPCWAEWRKAQPRRGTKRTIRMLRNDETPPLDPPRRYVGKRCIRLRWKVAPSTYVEALEHRIVAGRSRPHVHHINSDPTDNRQENLKPLTPLQHGAEHSMIDLAEATRLYAEGWSLPALGERYGVGNVTVMRFLKRRGVPMRTLKEAWVIRRRGAVSQRRLTC